MKIRGQIFNSAVLFVALAAFSGCDGREVQRQANSRALPSQAAEAPTSSRTGFVDVEGTRIAYRVHGDLASGKKPLVVLHGSLMSGASMAPMIDPFVATRPVIAIDARGHGRTGDVPGPLSYERMADDVAAVVRSLGLKRVDVLGYSMGATTALIAAVRHPDLIDKQVIVSGVSKAWRMGAGGAGQFREMGREDVRRITNRKRLQT